MQRYRPPSTAAVIERITSDPELLPAIRRLDPAVLGALIRRVGLEDTGALISLCSAGQLEAIFDADLWAGEAPGEAEQFRPGRFALWLEVLGELGDAQVIDRLLELDQDLLTMAVHELALVVYTDELVATGDADEAVDRYQFGELDELLVFARDPGTFDPLWSALVALDRDHHDLVRGVLERCAALAAPAIEADGLSQVLGDAEALADSVAGDREERRAASGYLAPEDARAFLRLAADGTGDPDVRDAITAAYFRRRRPRPIEVADSSRLRELLADELGDLERPAARPRLGDGSSGVAAFVAALAALADADPELHDQRRAELAYLANALVAGRGLRPIDAMEQVFAACAAGLGEAMTDLAQTSADLLFRRGYRLISASAS